MTERANLFLNEGDYWTIRYGSASFRLKGSKGLQYLATLLREPGREFHAIDLVSGPASPTPRRKATSRGRDDRLDVGGLGDAGDVIDAKAKAAYRKRVTDLMADLEEAEEFNDGERAARARAEIEALEEQLSAAFGLGGRARKVGSAAERARVNVRNSVTTAIRSIEPHGPELAEHLRKAVRTGTFCWYAGEGQRWILDPTEADQAEFGESQEAERVLGTFLFTDIVSSTERAAALGDGKWRKLLDQHDSAVRTELEAHAGRAVNTFGDGFFAIFDRPAAAIQCALALRERLDGIGIAVRSGVHTGECDRRGDDFGGIGLHIAARVLAEAEPGQVLVSSTVHEIVVGSGFEFVDTGFHALRGVPGMWRLFAVAGPTTGATRRKTKGQAAALLSLMIVDDHPMWRQTLRTVLEGSGVGIVVAEAADGEEAVEMARAAHPEAVIMDMNLLTTNGVEATRRLLEVLPETKVLMLSSSDERDDVVSAVQAGASGYLLKTAEPHEVADAVRRIRKGELVFPPALAKVVLEEFRRRAVGPSQRKARKRS